MTSGSAFLINNKFDLRNDFKTNQEIISTCSIFILKLFGIISPFYFLIFFVLKDKIFFLSGIPIAVIYFSIVEILGHSLWSISYTITILEKKSKSYAFLSIFRTLIRYLSILSSIFIFKNYSYYSLFIGSFVSGIISIVSFLLLSGKYIELKNNSKIEREIFNAGSILFASQSFESIKKTLERWLLALFVGVDTTAIFSHAQIYPNILLLTIKPCMTAIWPIQKETLANTQEPPPKIINDFYIWVTNSIFLSGILMALIGSEIISFLTNDKFTNAAFYAAILLTSEVFYKARQPQFASLIFLNKPKSLAFSTSIASVSSIIFGFLLIPRIKLIGAIIAIVIGGLIYFFTIDYLAKRNSNFKNQNLYIVKGLLLISVLLFTLSIFKINFLFRLCIALFLTYIHLQKTIKLFKKQMQNIY